jgi:hypothetical protein
VRRAGSGAGATRTHVVSGSFRFLPHLSGGLRSRSLQDVQRGAGAPMDGGARPREVQAAFFARFFPALRALRAVTFFAPPAKW